MVCKLQHARSGEGNRLVPVQLFVITKGLHITEIASNKRLIFRLKYLYIYHKEINCYKRLK